MLSHLGGYGIPIELFAPFTDSCVVVMKRLIESMANAKDDDKKAPRQRSAALGFCHSGIQQGVSVRFYTFQQVFANAAASLLKLWYVASRSETFFEIIKIEDVHFFCKVSDVLEWDYPGSWKTVPVNLLKFMLCCS